MKNVKKGIISVLLTLHFATGGAQFYGTYGRSRYLSPVNFPQQSIQQQYMQNLHSVQIQHPQHSVPLFNRLNPDSNQTAPATQPIPQNVSVYNNQLVDSRISHGAEMFSFEMFRVSSLILNDLF